MYCLSQNMLTHLHAGEGFSFQHSFPILILRDFWPKRMLTAGDALARVSQTSFSSSPPRPKKRVKERVAGVARERHTGNTLFIHLGWGLAAIRATFEKPRYPGFGSSPYHQTGITIEF